MPLENFLAKGSVDSVWERKDSMHLSKVLTAHSSRNKVGRFNLVEKISRGSSNN